ncbi:hypothetical protein A2108_02310 [Candidatus Wolfebacteria bacterium GWA1_42_9]|uniref:Uncharacterized protein n=1 Tax=Candidatus Wolfebacteria bacterium GWA1_42_9 TaxID=1802553 RepID=A0A1F8DMW0_9BACT|nr:MAG: hypothetical protein A2108_02310 [Candidatus Wolfebacteria bacterium GWA1_42_9]
MALKKLRVVGRWLSVVGQLPLAKDKNVENFQNSGQIDDQQGDVPVFVIIAGGFPESDPLPDYYPSQKQIENQGVLLNDGKKVFKRR